MESSSNLSKSYWSKANKWFINTYENSWLEQVIHGPVKLRENIAITATDLVSAETLLDLGCGPSRVLAKALLETKVESAIGLDFSKYMLSESEAYLTSLGLINKVKLDNVDLIKSEDYPKADICYALGLFDYIQDAEAILKKAHQSSNYLVASWPAKNARNYLRKFRYSCPVYTYNKEDISTLFSSLNISSLRFIPSGGFSGYITISKN